MLRSALGRKMVMFDIERLVNDGKVRRKLDYVSTSLDFGGIPLCSASVSTLLLYARGFIVGYRGVANVCKASGCLS